MVTVAVVYHSGQGHTQLMAESVVAGARGAGAKAELHRIEGDRIDAGRFEDPTLLDALDRADAIVFGAPTHMGSVSGPMKCFLDATLQRWVTRAWQDKVAAGFTVSSTPSGDKLHALSDLSICALQLGMIWVGQARAPEPDSGINRLSVYLGAAGQAHYGGPDVALHDGDLATGSALGARVAELTGRFTAGSGG